MQVLFRTLFWVIAVTFVVLVLLQNGDVVSVRAFLWQAEVPIFALAVFVFLPSILIGFVWGWIVGRRDKKKSHSGTSLGAMERNSVAQPNQPITAAPSSVHKHSGVGIY